MTETTILSSKPASLDSLVMITGAAGGLGKAFAVECASRGWNLFLTDLRASQLEVLAASLRATYGVKVLALACDLTDADHRAGLFEAIQANQLRFWALINVAGLDYEGLFHECSRQQIRTILRLNIEGTLEMTHALLTYRDPLAAFRIINLPLGIIGIALGSGAFFSWNFREQLVAAGVIAGIGWLLVKTGG